MLIHLKMAILKTNLFLILAVILGVFAIIPLFHSGFFPIHDNEQIGRLYELNQALTSGQFPVRITQNLGFGYGYLLFNFYPPFVYYFSEIFKLIGFSFISSIKIMIISGFLLSSFFMYLLTKEFFGKYGGLVASIFYIYVPYRAIDLYVRGALPELFSFAIIPAIFWAYLKLQKTSRFHFILLAAFFDFILVTTHNLVALMFIPFFLLFICFLFWKSEKRKVFAIQVLTSFIISILLSSFFIFPALLENKYTMVSLLTKELADYNQHFVYLRQFINSAWGYGGSIYGLKDGLSFEVGKIHLLGALIALILLTFSFIKKRKFEALIVLTFLLFNLSVFLQTFYSKFIWDLLPPLSYIQFPWRFLMFSAFFSSFIVGSIFYLIHSPKLKAVASVVLIFLVIIVNINFFKPKTYFTNYTDASYTSEKVLRWETSKMAFEYVPAGIETKKSDIGNSVVNINENEIAKKSFEVTSGVMTAIVKKDQPNLKEFNVSVKTGGEFRVNSYAYPGWKILVNGQEINYNANNKLKLISFHLNPGNYDILAAFKDTAVRKISNFLSFAGILVFIFLTIMFFTNRAVLKKFYLDI